MPAKKTASRKPVDTRPTDKELFLMKWEAEFPTTLRVLKAFPPDKADLQPHEKSKNAMQLATTIAGEERAFVMGILSGSLDFSQMPKPFATWDGLIAWYEESHAEMVRLYRAASDDELSGTIPFYTAPGKMEAVPKFLVLWMFLFDCVHHRGQFSVYLRMAGGKVPSIYGPTADEPWPMG